MLSFHWIPPFQPSLALFYGRLRSHAVLTIRVTVGYPLTIIVQLIIIWQSWEDVTRCGQVMPRNNGNRYDFGGSI